MIYSIPQLEYRAYAICIRRIFLISEKLADALETTIEFRTIELGEAELRGKHEKMNLYTVERIKNRENESRKFEN